MEARKIGRRAIPPWLRALCCALTALALAVPVAQAGDEVSAAGRCGGEDDFRDLDGDGCAEPLVSAGDVRLQFVRDARGGVTVRLLVLSAARDAAVEPLCRPKCRARVYDAGGRRVEVDFRGQRFKPGTLVGVRVWSEGFVGRFFGYRIGESRVRYMACLVRWYDGPPKRCHS